MPEQPVVLELAPLPREQIGPFLLLGLEKDAGPEQVEANWAQRVIWSRKSQINVPLEDINWAREVINDPDKRIRADAATLNADTIDGTLGRLAEQYGSSGRPLWQPRDVEKPLVDYTPAVEIPDLDQVRQASVLPEAPSDLPGVSELLEKVSQEPLDPWTIELPSARGEETSHE